MTAYFSILFYRWILDCGTVFRTYKESWAHLIPSQPEERAILAEHFFNTACSLMARQLRECVQNSFDEFLSFLELYKVTMKGINHITLHYIIVLIERKSI